MKRTIIFGIALFASLYGCKEDPQTAGQINGIVRDEVSRDPLEGATIQVDGISTTYSTDSDGKYTIADLAPGTYTLTASYPGYFSLEEELTLNAGQLFPQNFLLSAALPTASPEEVYLNNNINSETVTLTNQSSKSMSFTTETSQTWLSVDPTSGTVHAGGTLDLIVTADYTDLPVELYEESISVTVGDAVLNIPVDINLNEAVEITWKNWYLSVPIDNGDGKATSIYYEDIINDNLTEAEREYFYYDATAKGYAMYTKFTGYTTSGEQPINGDAYCRTELREFWQGIQDTDDNWFMNTGETHLLESTLRVDNCGGNDRTFIAQIHGKKSTDPEVTNGPATVKVLWEDGDIEVEYYVKPADPAGEWTSDTNAKSARIKVDNEKFTIKLRVQDGILAYAIICEAKGINNDFIDLYDYASNGYHYDNYFKTGNYFQWKSDYTESSQVTLFKVITHHE